MARSGRLNAFESKENRVSEGPAGIIIGGWPYVIAAYSITAVVLAANIARLASRERKTDKKKESDSNG